MVVYRYDLQVPVAVVLSYFILGERMETLDYVGAVLIIIGLLLVVYSNWYAEKLRKETDMAVVFGRSVEERQALINSHDDIFDAPLKAKSFTREKNIQQ